MGTTGELPADVNEIIEHIGTWAEGYGYLKWNEQAKVKADMMNVRGRWAAWRVDANALRRKCLAVGLTKTETDEIVGWLRKVQAGRRLVPKRGYRAFRFTQEPVQTEPRCDDDDPDAPSTTLEW